MPFTIGLVERAIVTMFLAGFTLPLAAAQSVRYAAPIFDQVGVKADLVLLTAQTPAGERQELRLDVYEPAPDTERSRPAILWLHGQGANRKQDYIVRLAMEFAKRGYVCVASDYRRDEAAVPLDRKLQDGIEDAQAALTWVRAHTQEYGIDPKHIALGGGSAGGSIAWNVIEANNSNAARTGAAEIFAFVDLWGSPSAQYLKAPIGPHFAPTIIIHGTADQSIPFRNSEILDARLAELGIVHKLLPLPGARHTPIDQIDLIIRMSAQFVYERLGR